MRQITNITIFIIVLSIPFALSQTRKAIPAGRYEALSGVKILRGQKNIENSGSKDKLDLFWSEVGKHIPKEQNKNTYFISGEFAGNAKSLFEANTMIESSIFDSKVNIFLSDDLNRDYNFFEKIKKKGSLVILKDKHLIKEVMLKMNRFEVLIYQTEIDNNYYLLKVK